MPFGRLFEQILLFYHKREGFVSLELGAAVDVYVFIHNDVGKGALLL